MKHQIIKPVCQRCGKRITMKQFREKLFCSMDCELHWRHGS